MMLRIPLLLTAPPPPDAPALPLIRITCHGGEDDARGVQPERSSQARPLAGKEVRERRTEMHALGWEDARAAHGDALGRMRERRR